MNRRFGERNIMGSRIVNATAEKSKQPDIFRRGCLFLYARTHRALIKKLLSVGKSEDTKRLWQLSPAHPATPRRIEAQRRPQSLLHPLDPHPHRELLRPDLLHLQARGPRPRQDRLGPRVHRPFRPGPLRLLRDRQVQSRHDPLRRKFHHGLLERKFRPDLLRNLRVRFLRERRL